jgi:hypothetical protein
VKVHRNLWYMKSMVTKSKKLDYTKNILQPGQRVKLLANEEEGWEEEFGVVVKYEGNGLYCVIVDKQYRQKEDDGLREVMQDYLEPV